MATNREIERDALVALVNANMVGSGLPLQACYGYQDAKSWPGKQSPVLIISSGGSERIKNAASTGGWITTFYFHADAFVLYADDTWTEADCEDRLDLIDVELFELLQANSHSKKKYNPGRSTAGSVVISGEEYRRERTPIEVSIYKA